MLLILTETLRYGRYYSTGDILYTSETNSVTARFSSDYRTTRSEFRLDVKSIPCTDVVNYLQHLKYDEQEVQLSAGEVQKGARASETIYLGNYPNDASQNWNIITDENEIYI